MLIGTKNYLDTCTRYENSQCISKELFVRSRKKVNIGNVNSRSTGTHLHDAGKYFETKNENMEKYIVCTE
jgi:hypothetical protein